MPNAKVLESKKAVVEALSAKIKESTSIVFVDYKGINVAQDTALRQQFREAGVEYTVVKNTLTRFATKENGYDFDEVLNGTTAMASTTGDPIAPARIVCEYAKKNKLPLAIKGGVVEGKAFDAAGIEEISKIPGREALISRLLGSMQSPIANLARVLNQIAEKDSAPAEEAPAAE